MAQAATAKVISITAQLNKRTKFACYEGIKKTKAGGNRHDDDLEITQAHLNRYVDSDAGYALVAEGAGLSVNTVRRIANYKKGDDYTPFSDTLGRIRHEIGVGYEVFYEATQKRFMPSEKQDKNMSKKENSK